MCIKEGNLGLKIERYFKGNTLRRLMNIDFFSVSGIERFWFTRIYIQ